MAAKINTQGVPLLAAAHGAKAWNIPRDDSCPAVYIQDHAFDAAFGANNSIPNQIYVGRDDITKLYSSSSTSLTTSPSTNYTETVIGPDGYNFSDLGVAFSMLAYESPALDLLKTWL